MNAHPLAALNGVSMSYRFDGGAEQVLRNVTLEFYERELILLFGPSGSGKTSLLTLLAGLLPATDGTVNLFGRSVSSMSPDELQNLRARRIGFVFQNFLLLEGLTIADNIRIALEFAGWEPEHSSRRIDDLLARFGCSHLARRYPDQCSQGERQRAAIIRAIAAGAALILADEPTASLDYRRGQEVIEQLRALSRKDGCCVIVASHDPRLRLYADRIITVDDGTVSEGSGSQDVGGGALPTDMKKKYLYQGRAGDRTKEETWRI